MAERGKEGERGEADKGRQEGKGRGPKEGRGRDPKRGKTAEHRQKNPAGRETPKHSQQKETQRHTPPEVLAAERELASLTTREQLQRALGAIDGLKGRVYEEDALKQKHIDHAVQSALGGLGNTISSGEHKGKAEVRLSSGRTQYEGVPVDEVIEMLKDAREKLGNTPEAHNLEALQNILYRKSAAYFDVQHPKEAGGKHNVNHPELTEEQSKAQHARTEQEAYFIHVDPDYRAFLVQKYPQFTEKNPDNDYKLAMEVMRTRRELVIDTEPPAKPVTLKTAAEAVTPLSRPDTKRAAGTAEANATAAPAKTEAQSTVESSPVAEKAREAVIIGESVRGSSHERVGKIAQHAIHFESLDNGDRFLGIADGHGSEKAFRSDRGSRFAAEIITEEMKTLAEKFRNGEIASLEDYIERELPERVLIEWQNRVRENYSSEPFTSQEIEELRAALEKKLESNIEGIIQKIEGRPEIAYGSTVLGASFINGEYLVLTQLGDGDIVLVDQEGKAIEPMPKDPRLIANYTTSLSGGEPSEMRAVVIKIDPKNPPRMVMVSTDGLSNSFDARPGFLKVATDIEGMEDQTIKEDLSGRLREYTEKGSGEDITLGIIRLPVLKVEGGNDIPEEGMKRVRENLSALTTRYRVMSKGSADNIITEISKGEAASWGGVFVWIKNEMDAEDRPEIRDTYSTLAGEIAKLSQQAGEAKRKIFGESKDLRNS
jgi:serine/threonine protein phosphatase PrpC